MNPATTKKHSIKKKKICYSTITILLIPGLCLHVWIARCGQCCTHTHTHTRVRAHTRMHAHTHMHAQLIITACSGRSSHWCLCVLICFSHCPRLSLGCFHTIIVCICPADVPSERWIKYTTSLESTLGWLAVCHTGWNPEQWGQLSQASRAAILYDDMITQSVAFKYFCYRVSEWMNEWSVLFNDTLNTFSYCYMGSNIW